MSYYIFPIAAARKNCSKFNVLDITQEIIRIMNSRIGAASQKGKWYTDYFYIYQGEMSTENAREIIFEVEDEYRKAHYNINIEIEEHDKEVLKLYIKIIWEEAAE